MPTTLIDWSQHVLRVARIDCVWDGADVAPTPYVHHLTNSTHVIQPMTATTQSTAITVSQVLPKLVVLTNEFNKLVADVNNTKEVLNGICHDLHRTGVIPGSSAE